MTENPIFIIGLGIPDSSPATLQNSDPDGQNSRTVVQQTERAERAKQVELTTRLGQMVQLSPEAAQAVMQAEVMAAGRRQLEMFAEHKARKIPVTHPVSAVFENLEAERKQGKKVAILADGDPLLFGIAESAVNFWGIENLRIFPNSSSLQAAAAFLGLSWAEITPLSLHGRNNWRPLGAALQSGKTLGIFTDIESNPQRIAQFMLERGADSFHCHVLENIHNGAEGPKPEKHFSGSVEEMAKVESGANCLVIATPKPRTKKLHRLIAGQPDFAFFSHKNAVMSSFAARNLSCGILRPAPESTVWDLGAGSGAMSIELCSRVHRGQVIAVEKKSHQLVNLYENRKRFAATNLEIIEDSFPECLSRPEFAEKADRIFIGGGFGPALNNNPENALRTMRTIWDNLKPGGRLVANCVLLESMFLLHNCLKEIHGEPEITQIQTSQAVRLASGTRFAPDNPLFILSIDKPRTEQEDDILPKQIY